MVGAGIAAQRAHRRPLAPVPPDARQYAVRMPDGVLLATDVYLPPGIGRWPALLSRVPYDKAGDECFLPQVARWFTEHGYAVVVQDVRGKVRSGGVFTPFETEAVDGYHTLDWVAGQRWCDGAVGMFGDSYYGFTQWAVAATGHPALRAIAPRTTSADFTQMMNSQGVFELEVMAYWAFETLVDEALYDYDGQLDWGLRPLAEVVPAALGGRRPFGLDDWARGLVPTGSRVPVRGDVPALHLGGFADFLLPAQLSTWRQARGAAAAPQYLVLDATDHVWTPLREPDQPYRDPLASDAAMHRFLDHYLAPLLPFFDHHLRDTADYRQPPVRWRLGRTGNRWRADETWPPTGSAPLTWTLTGDPTAGRGALTTQSETAVITADWIHDPRHPVPSRVHPFYSLVAPADEQDLHTRPDLLCFTTDPLVDRLDLAGPVTVNASLSAGSDTTHLMATLYDVSPDGTTHRILDGAALARAPWPAGVSVQLGDSGYRLRRGHRLRLTLATSAFPRYVLHPGTTADPWTATTATPTSQNVVLGGSDGARLTCHVLGTREQPR